MRAFFLSMFLLLVVSVAAVPDYVDFHLELDWISIMQSPSFEYVQGTLTITNNGTVPWIFESNYLPIAIINFDGDQSGMGWFNMPSYLNLPPHQSVILEVERYSNCPGLAPGTHSAQAYLFYGPGVYHEAVGNVVTFSVDQILSELTDLDWTLEAVCDGLFQINATITATNDSDYFWKRQFPYNTVFGLGLDGDIPDKPSDEDLHWQCIGAHNQSSYDLLTYTNEPFSPGDHYVQAYAFTSDGLPEAIGDPVMFHIQGSYADEQVFPAYSVRINPNPLRDNSVLSLNSQCDFRVDLSVYNARGQLITRRCGLDVFSGQNQIQLNTLFDPDIPSGLYIIRLNGLYGSTTIKAFKAD